MHRDRKKCRALRLPAEARRGRRGTSVAYEAGMLLPALLIESNDTRIRGTDFWQCIFRDEQLRHCDNLEKLLAGCEIIAALDGVDLLAE